MGLCAGTMSLMRLALYQPEIAANAGAMLRLAACFGVAVDLIEPAGFLLDDKRFRRAGMDYIDRVSLTRHASWDAFRAGRTGRLVLLTTKAGLAHHHARFSPGDVLLVGRESAGVPAPVHEVADLSVRIPMRGEARSFNVALAAAIVLAEALRQTESFPETSE